MEVEVLLVAVVDERARFLAAVVSICGLCVPDDGRGLHEELEVEVAEQSMLDRALLLREGAACVQVEALAAAAVVRVPEAVARLLAAVAPEGRVIAG